MAASIGIILFLTLVSITVSRNPSRICHLTNEKGFLKFSCGQNVATHVPLSREDSSPAKFVRKKRHSKSLFKFKCTKQMSIKELQNNNTADLFDVFADVINFSCPEKQFLSGMKVTRSAKKVHIHYRCCGYKNFKSSIEKIVAEVQKG